MEVGFLCYTTEWRKCGFTFKMSPVPLNPHYRIETGRPQTGIVHKLWAYMPARRLTHASSLKHTAQRLLSGSVSQSAWSWYQWVWDGTHAAVKDSFLVSVLISKSSHPRRGHHMSEPAAGRLLLSKFNQYVPHHVSPLYDLPEKKKKKKESIASFLSTHIWMGQEDLHGFVLAENGVCSHLPQVGLQRSTVELPLA